MMMVEEKETSLKSRLGQFKGMHAQTRSMVIESDNSLSPVERDRITSRSQASIPNLSEPSTETQNSKIGCALNRTDNVKSRPATDGAAPAPVAKETKQPPSDMAVMKEKFSKLLLGEDMSGGGKGVSSALALSNAITNLAASAFGEQRKLEPMAADTKARWRKEIDWLLSVTDHIVEFVASKQKQKDGSLMDVMITKQRNDLQVNVPALRKLDAMLLDCLENFKDQNEFYYTKAKEDDDKNGTRNGDKWWIPTPKVPPDGLSEVTRKWMQYQKDSVNQVLKAAMAINAQVLSEMEIPESYIESLPKNGRASLGDLIYKSITDDYFDPDFLLSSLDLTSEHKILDLKNKIEASVVIWKRKMTSKDSKSSWGSTISMEKREMFEDRAETILLILKHRFPGTPQSSLDISKIQENRDVGHAILESYSRIIESLAFTVLSRIEDVMHADSLARDPSIAEQKKSPLKEPTPLMCPSTKLNAKAEVEKLNSADAPASMTLFDFMGWAEESEAENNKDSQEDAQLSKPPQIITSKKSYLDNLGLSRSPTSRH